MNGKLAHISKSYTAYFTGYEVLTRGVLMIHAPFKLNMAKRQLGFVRTRNFFKIWAHIRWHIGTPIGNGWKRRKSGEITIMRTYSIGPTQYCSMNKERHIPAVLRHPHKRPTQPPTLPCTRTPSMQSKDRAWRTTRNQPPAIGLDNHKPPERTTAQPTAARAQKCKGREATNFGASTENGSSDFTSSQALMGTTSNFEGAHTD